MKIIAISPQTDQDGRVIREYRRTVTIAELQALQAAVHGEADTEAHIRSWLGAGNSIVVRVCGHGVTFRADTEQAD